MKKNAFFRQLILWIDDNKVVKQKNTMTSVSGKSAAANIGQILPQELADEATLTGEELPVDVLEETATDSTPQTGFTALTTPPQVVKDEQLFPLSPLHEPALFTFENLKTDAGNLILARTFTLLAPYVQDIPALTTIASHFGPNIVGAIMLALSEIAKLHLAITTPAAPAAKDKKTGPSIEAFYTKAPKDAKTGVILSLQIFHTIANSTGVLRIIDAKYQLGNQFMPVSQEAFSNAVHWLWNNFDEQTQLFLSQRILNPRAPVSLGALQARLEFGNEAELEAAERQAAKKLLDALKEVNVHVIVQPGNRAVVNNYFYFIPHEGAPQSRTAHESTILGLLRDGRISAATTIVGLNAYVSVFPLTLNELSKMMNMELRQDEVDHVLEQFRTILAPEKVEPVEAPPDTATQHAGYYRELYQKELSEFPVEERRFLAQDTNDEHILAALCFDPDPSVITAVLANARAGLVHARLIAEHHKSSVGLESLGLRDLFLHDQQVRHLLFKNSATPEGLLRRMMHTMILKDLFTLVIGRERSEHAKLLSDQIFSNKFASASAEEKVSFIFATEGRCLTHLTGMRFDSNTVQLLCHRDYPSIVLIRNLALFPGTPIEVLKRLLCQRAIQKNLELMAEIAGRIRSR